MATAPTNANMSNIITVPKNWKTMFGNTNPDDANNMFLTIRAFSPPKVNALATDLTRIYDFEPSKFIGGYKFFYPRDNIQEQIKHVYSESTSKFSEALGELRSGITKNFTAVVEASSGTTGGALTEEPHIFTKSERRTFSINIPLVAYNDLEKDIYSVLRFFRKYSYARRATTSKLSGLLNAIEYPSVFKISGGLFDTNQPVGGSSFVLEDCTIDYNPSVKTFMKGLPVEAILTLGFTELNLIFGEDFDATPVNVNVSESSSREDVQRILSKSTETRVLDNIANITKPSKNAVKLIGVGAEAVDESILDKISDYVKKSPLAKRASNLPDTISNVVKSEVREAVQTSSLYKKVTSVTVVDPLHLLEVKAILGKIRGL
jgi:hypothetical protein